ncbi:methyl-accepting chemotaxis protein [Methanolobus sp. ZRKC4]|uniref:methyl-accepting chemotaxis protein n=1 Tax=Methanolobus sp. ZRKC4 TaxID=3125787 RepID=UPI003247E246
MKEEIINVANAVKNGSISSRVSSKFTGTNKEVVTAINAMLDHIFADTENELKGSVINTELLNLTQKIIDGKLDSRVNPENFTGDDQELVQKINELLDAVVTPLNVTVQFVDDVAHGRNLEKITDDYNGEFSKVKININQCIDVVHDLLDETAKLTSAAINGKLDSRSDTSKFEGGWSQITGGINNTLDAVIGPLNVAAEYIDRISKGDVPEKINDEYKGDFNEIKNNLNQCIDAVNSLVDDSLSLAQAGIDGKLDTRADANKHAGDFRRIVEGVNGCLDAVIGPLNVAAEYIDRISKGDVPEKINDEYKGDFNEIKNNLNQCIDAVNSLVDDSLSLAQAGIDGKLDTRADANKHAGDFRRIVEGVNGCLDAVIGPLNVAAEYIDRISKGDVPEKINDEYKGDFNEIKNNLNQCIDAVNSLVDDSLSLAQAGIDGKLDTRADANKHAGDFRRIVEGVNGCLDAVIGPLNVAAEYIDRISKGDVPEKINDEYKGDFNEIKNNLNQCIDAVNSLVDDSLSLAQAGIDGKLDTRADANKHAGDFRRIVEGVNGCLDAVIGPLNVAAEYIDRISKGDVPEKINDEYKGDFNEIKNNLNQCIDAVNSLVDDSLSLAQAGIDGKLDTRADANKHAGDFRRIVEGINGCLDAIVTPIEEASRIIEAYASGHLDTRVNFETRGDFKKLSNVLDNFGQELQAMIADSNAVLSSLSNNDLTRHVEIEGVGEFKELTDGIENCRYSLNEIVSIVRNDADNIAATAEEMSVSSEEITSSADQITTTINEIAKGAQMQSSKTEEVSKAMIDMTLSVQEVATNSQKTAENAINSNDVVRDLSDVTQDLTLKMDNIKNAAGDSAQHINDLAEKSSQIGEIVNLITSIADQTNLLALNAAIEAARAGEHGRGFAVVADEVRKLAEDSGNAAKQIADLINQIQTGTANAVTSMDQATGDVAIGAKSLEEAVDSINKVVEANSEVVKMVQDIAAAAEEQSASIEEVTSSVEEVSSISEQSAAGTQEASATVEEQTAAMQELATSSQELSRVAADMQSVVVKFKLDQEGGNDIKRKQGNENEDVYFGDLNKLLV